MNLTKNFTLEEMSHSETALAHGLNNQIPLQYIANLKSLATNVLQPLRDHIGQPVKVTSGYRTPALNHLVGGASTSQHLTGHAADIRGPSGNKLTHMRWFVWMMDNLAYDQLIWEKGGQWIHVSYRSDGKNRQQVLLK